MSGEDELRAERDHWIGEAKYYERLYRHKSEAATRWFKRMRAAEAALVKPETETDRDEGA